MQNTSIWENNGKCGGEALMPLPVMLGDPMWRCPTALAQNEDVQTILPLLAGPNQKRACTDDYAMTLPPKWRAIVEYADALKEAYDSRKEPAQ